MGGLKKQMAPGSLLSVTFVLAMAPSKLVSSPHVLGVPKIQKMLWNQRSATYVQRPGGGSEWPLPVLSTLPALKQLSPTQLVSEDTWPQSLWEPWNLSSPLFPSFRRKKKSIKTVFWLKTPCCVRQHMFHLLSWGGVEKVNQHPRNEQCVLFECFQF